MHKIDIHKLADEAKLNSFHYKLIGWVILILVLDGYDIAITGAALPAIMADLKIDSTQAGFLASASLVGMMVGTVLFGILADKFGRRWTLAIAVALFSLLTASAGFTRDPIVFAILRFIAGLGLGGVLPILIALGTEYMPVKVRARLVALTSCGYAAGGVLAAILGKGLIDSYGWQGVFIAAGAPVVVIPFILKYIPESLPLLVKLNRDAELREMVRKIAPNYPLQAQEQFLVPHEDEVETAPVSKVFQDGPAFSTVMFWVANFAGLFMLYALNTWLTKLMATLGYSLGSALTFVIAYNIGAMVGAVGGGWLFDKLHPKWRAVLFLCDGCGVADCHGLRRCAWSAVPHRLRGRRLYAGHPDPDQRLRWHVLSNGDPLHCRRLQLRGRADRRDSRPGPDRLAGRAEPGPEAKLRGDRGCRRDRRDRGRIHQSRRLRVDAPHRCGGGEGGGGEGRCGSACRRIGPRLTARRSGAC